MPRIPGSEKPPYASVEAYLTELAEDIALLLDPAKTARFREQLSLYNKAWTAWEAKRKKRWKPAMGKPGCPLRFFRWEYRKNYDPDKEAKILPGFYSLIAFIHDSQLPHLDKINNVIESSKIIKETLAVPKSMLTAKMEGGKNIDEIYLIVNFRTFINVLSSGS